MTDEQKLAVAGIVLRVVGSGLLSEEVAAALAREIYRAIFESVVAPDT